MGGQPLPIRTEVLTLSSTHLSKSLLSLNSHSSPEDVMQKVLSAFFPRPQATSVNRLLRSSPSSPERPSRGTVAFTCGDTPLLLPVHPGARPGKPGPEGRGDSQRAPLALRDYSSAQTASGSPRAPVQLLSEQRGAQVGRGLLGRAEQALALGLLPAVAAHL